MATQSVPGTAVPAGAAIGPAGGFGAQGNPGPAGGAGPIGQLGNEDVGSIKAWPTPSPPPSWMIMDNSAISRTLYPDLFALIGTTFGPGDGSTTFNLPDARGSFILSMGNSGVNGSTLHSLGDTGGEELHALVAAENANHTHSASQPTHSHNIGSAINSSHIAVGTTGQGPYDFLFAPTAGSAWLSGTTSASGASITIANQGSGTGHNTMPPFLCLVYIIKVSKTGGATAQAPIADSTQPGLLDTLSGNSTDYVGGDNNCYNLANAVQPTIWSARLRSFNAIGNPTFEVGQADVGASLTIGAAQAAGDRWRVGKAGMSSFAGTSQRQGSGAMGGTNQIRLPGTSFTVTNFIQRITVTTALTTLAAGDLLWLNQQIEGPFFRELQNDVHSLSLLVRSSVANLIFAISLRDPATTTVSLTKLCNLGAANTLSLIQLPNLPIWSSSGGFTSSSASVGYQLSITLACGSTYMAPANDTWQNGNFYGGPGMSNFAANAGATFDIAFVQHEPGPVCTTLIDKPFTQNLDECLRYYQKSYDYPNAVGSTGTFTQINWWQSVSTTTALVSFPFKKTMAKTPTVVGYSVSSGTANAIRDVTAATDRGISGYNIGMNGIQSLNLASAPAANAQISMHYTADTGW